MMYVKTYESFLSNFFPKKIPTYPYIRNSLGELFYKISYLNKLFEYTMIDTPAQTDYVERHYKLHKELSQYDFIIESDSRYLFDIKSFISESYIKFFDISKSNRKVENDIMKFIVKYYNEQKFLHDNRIHSREYESIFVKDPFVDMGSVMKKVNENVVPSEDNNNLLPLERSEYIEYMSGVLDKLNIEYTIDITEYDSTRARHILKIKNEFHPIIIPSSIKDGRRISYIMDITGMDENPHIHTKGGLMNELLRSMGVNVGGVMKKINESLPSNNKDNIIPLDMKEYITYINSILDKFNIPYEYFYNNGHSESNHIINKKIQLKSFILMVGDRGLFRVIGNDDDYIYNKSDVVQYLLNLLNINMGDVMKKINKK